MDALGKALEKRMRRRGQALKSLRGDVARQSVESAASRAGKKRVTLYLPVDKWRELKILAAIMDTTLDALMRGGVDLVLAEHKGKPPKGSPGA
jgi:hypothetical protein